MIKKLRNMRTWKKVLLIIAVVIVLIALFVIIANAISIGNTRAFIKTLDAVDYENQILPQMDSEGYYTFTKEGDFKVLQLTDIHIGAGFMSGKKDRMAVNAIAAMITAEKPDLVVATGDIAFPVPYVSGTFNNRTSQKLFMDLMEQLGVYYTVSLGNHDSEIYSYFNRESVAKFYEKEEYEHCLFQRGEKDIDGEGNQVIKIKNELGLNTQALITLDSHSYTDGDYFGMYWKYDKIHDNQIEWYEREIKKLSEENVKTLENIDTKLLGGNADSYEIVKSQVFFHIPIEEMKFAYEELKANKMQSTDKTTLVEGLFNEPGEAVYCSIYENNLFEKMLELKSTQGVFFGHDHMNNASVIYEGIRLTYGMSIDYLAYSEIETFGNQRGCTVITIKTDGSSKVKLENYYQEKYESKADKEQVTLK